MEKRVILRCGYGKFEHLADEVREDRAATASLRIQVRHIGYGHIIGEIKRIVPINIPIQYA